MWTWKRGIGVSQKSISLNRPDLSINGPQGGGGGSKMSNNLSGLLWMAPNPIRIIYVTSGHKE